MQLDLQDTEKGNGRIIQVLVPYPVDKAYSYLLPPGLSAKPGGYVRVPLGSREVVGVVWGNESDEKINLAKLKSVIEVYDVTPLPEVHRKFIDWLAHYTMSMKGAVLKMTVSTPAALEREKPVTCYQKPPQFDTQTSLSSQRQKVIDVLSDGLPRRAAEIAERAGCSAGVVKGMADKKLLEVVETFPPAPCRNPDLNYGGVALSDDQDAAAKQLIQIVQSEKYKAVLVDGVTGAGKTEVYFEAVAQALSQDKQALILLPEIALSNAFLDRFEQRFGCKPALWHSALSPAQRRRTWRGIADGESKVVIGARSALFLPYKDLGLIVVDEEHDPSYKQEDNVIYNARDMAVVRAHMGSLPVILISATPSLETMANIWAGRYDHLKLPDRFGGANLPSTQLIDLKNDKPERQKFLAPTLLDAMTATLEKKEQILLFLNRRGYAPLTICRTCGHRFECPRCTAWLVEHKRSNKLHCHHCGFETHIPNNCPSCDDTDSLAACGPGVERIYEEVRELFPEARALILASDLLPSNDDFRAAINDIKEGKYDIIIGTQIIAKGHHFPRLTCVGVVDADIGLKGGDLRAAERTFQLLHQVSGRAGREDLPGKVFIQTFIPDNKVMRALAAEKRDEFYDIEAQEREGAHMPPYSRLAGIIVSGKDETMVADTARMLGQSSPYGNGIKVLGPAEAPIYRLRGNYRRRLLVQADKNIDIQKAIQAWLGTIKTPSTIRIYIDIDPQSFL